MKEGEWRKVNEEWWRMLKDERRMMKDEGWMMKDDGFKLLRGFAEEWTDKQTNRRTDIAHWAKNGGHVTYFMKSNYFSSKTVWMYLDNLDMIFDNS